MLPRNLVIVRHGQSKRNLANRLAYKGDLRALEDIITRPSAVAPLTDEGVEQAKITGQWLRDSGMKFHRWYTSSFVRARQTAGYLDPHGADWFIENQLRERSSGVMEDMKPDERVAYLKNIRNRMHEFDPLNFRPTDGESFADVVQRHRDFLGTLHRECGRKNVLVVSHGHCMRMFDYIIHRKTPEEFRRELRSLKEYPNCTVLHFTRVNPETGELARYPKWFRRCTPWHKPEPSAWTEIVRKRYTSAELLAGVDEQLEQLGMLEKNAA